LADNGAVPAIAPLAAPVEHRQSFGKPRRDLAGKEGGERALADATAALAAAEKQLRRDRRLCRRHAGLRPRRAAAKSERRRCEREIKSSQIPVPGPRLIWNPKLYRPTGAPFQPARAVAQYS